MRRFEVMPMDDDLWAVVDQGRVLYWYHSEEEAQHAALILASASCDVEAQAKAVMTYTGDGIDASQRFTGM